MRAYGFPRNFDVQWPDVADIKNYARKSCVGTFRGRGGDHRGYHRNKAAKRSTRRVFKRRARSENKDLCAAQE